jgi:rubredoxin
MSNRVWGWMKEKHCRWCGALYKAAVPVDRDGFCASKCKQAHYRAYKKYVIRASSPRQPDSELRGISE